jgi:hypothetical protein
MDAHHFSCLSDQGSGCRIGDRENAVIWPSAFIACMEAEPVGNLLGDKHDLLLFAAFRLVKDQLAALQVFHSELEHLAYPHPSAGHQFKHQAVPDFGGPEYDLIDRILLDDLPAGGQFFTVKLPEGGVVTWIDGVCGNVVAHEIEKAQKLRISDSFGIGLVALSELVEEGKDLVGGYLIDVVIAVVQAKAFDHDLIGSDRIFIWNG